MGGEEIKQSLLGLSIAVMVMVFVQLGGGVIIFGVMGVRSRPGRDLQAAWK